MNLAEALKVNDNPKVRRSCWVPRYYLTVERNEFFDMDGARSPISYTDVMSDDWEPYKEPCKHEPNPNHFEKTIDGGLKFMCMTCPEMIKATGWEAV